jgi:hypothetical protein
LSADERRNRVGGARVSIARRSLWRIRLAREAPRYVLSLLSLAGVAASIRFAVAPPVAALPAAALWRQPAPDRAAEGYAVLFARRYLTWDSSEPLVDARALEPFAGPGLEADAGMQPPASGEQRVEWAEVVQVREAAAGGHVYTVAAQTDTEGLLYLSVGVARTQSGSLALAGYPAFVGAPSATQAQSPSDRREVSEPALVTVLQRALRNYLAGSDAELAADLASGARVSVPGLALTLQSLQRVDWTADGHSVLAVLQADDTRGAQYTLAYELDVVRAQGRWEVSAVQMDPGA